MREAALQTEWSVDEEGVGREDVVIFVLFLILTILLQLIANYKIVFPRSNLFFPDGNWQVMPLSFTPPMRFSVNFLPQAHWGGGVTEQLGGEPITIIPQGDLKSL